MRAAAVISSAALACVLTLLPAQADERLNARTITGTHGTYHIPSGSESISYPVLIVEPDGAKVPALRKALDKYRDSFLVVESVTLDADSKRRGGPTTVISAVENALQECSNYHRAVLHSSWILVAAGRHAEEFVRLAFTQPMRFDGLLGYEDGLQSRWLPKDLKSAARLRVCHVGGGDDARLVDERLSAAGMFDGGLDGRREGGKKRSRLRSFMSGFRRQMFKKRASRDFDAVASYGQRTIETKSADGLTITGDLYQVGKEAPIILLFHQKESSRGEYGVVAERLNRAGFNCLAVEARAGDSWLGVRNRTAERAKRRPLAMNPVDARPDLERAVCWARELGFNGRMVLLGSGYSASLSIIIGAETKGLAAIVAFSPGDWIPPQGSIIKAAKKLKVPTLVIARPVEEGQAKYVFEAVASQEKELHIDRQGAAGAATLYRSPDPARVWKVLLDFLSHHTK